MKNETNIECNPYRLKPEKCFWKKTVQNVYPLDIKHWYSKKFAIADKAIATAGSCFAQHIGRELREKGYNYVDVEPAPNFLNKDKCLSFGYGMYSARYGNVYTPKQLLQLAKRALGSFTPDESFWIKDSGYVDPFRPTIEPEPFSTIEEVLINRDYHLKQVSQLFESTDVFVFTLGLTEAWASVHDGAVYPVCPGVSGGKFDKTRYKFINFSYADIRNDLVEFFAIMRQINPKMKFILTVSPVPLMATATNQQVVVASSYSKSVLRAIAGFLEDKYSYVDYFPSYEIISSHVMNGRFYNPDMRTVAHAGVDHVMRQFFAEHIPPASMKRKPTDNSASNDDIVCDEELLSAFGEPKK